LIGVAGAVIGADNGNLHDLFPGTAARTEVRSSATFSSGWGQWLGDFPSFDFDERI